LPKSASPSSPNSPRRPPSSGHPSSLLTILGLLFLLATPRFLPAQQHPITVVSINIAAIDHPAALARELRSRALHLAGVYLLQEVASPDRDRSAIATHLLPGRKMHVFFCAAFSTGPGRLSGLAILSRFPLNHTQVIPLKRNNLNFNTRTRIALAAILHAPSGPITVINTHLDTRIGLQERLAQLDPLLTPPTGPVRPTILAGDLNTNPHRWLFHILPLPFTQQQAEGVRRHLARYGFHSVIPGRQPTHDLLRMQLDWIFLKGLHATETRVQPLTHSDHHAILTTIQPHHRK
jgi:endonuclease/exonuclease/phosphatase family metal-dependent hydrolase